MHLASLHFVFTLFGVSCWDIFFKENARRRNPATFLGCAFIVFSQVQCVLGSQVSVNSHVMLPAPARCHFFFQGKTRLAGITRKFFKAGTKACGWPRSTVSKGDVGSCDSHLTRRVSLFEVKSWCEVMRLTLSSKTCACTYVVGGRVGMNDTCYFSFDM